MKIHLAQAFITLLICCVFSEIVAKNTGAKNAAAKFLDTLNQKKGCGSDCPEAVKSEPSDCHPKCHWECDEPVCNQVCEPVCAAPQCESRCRPMDCMKCDVLCEPPVCEVKCPTDQCTDGSCPECETVCKDPECHTECPKPVVECESVCEKPKCDWECHKPDDCPKPKCAFVCEENKPCGSSSSKKSDDESKSVKVDSITVGNNNTDSDGGDLAALCEDNCASLEDKDQHNECFERCSELTSVKKDEDGKKGKKSK